MPNEFIEILRTYGLAGVVMFALGWACVKLYNRNQELHDTLNEVGREAVKAIEHNTFTLNSMAEVNKTTTAAMQQLSTNMQQILWRNGVTTQKAGE